MYIVYFKQINNHTVTYNDTMIETLAFTGHVLYSRPAMSNCRSSW